MENLIAHVHVRDPEGGPRVLAPGDKVPDWALEQITNPKAWEGGRVPAARPAPEAKPNSQQPDGTTPPAPAAVKPPPRGGAGSGRDPWAAYARAAGHDSIAELATRDEILAALQAAGVPVE